MKQNHVRTLGGMKGIMYTNLLEEWEEVAQNAKYIQSKSNLHLKNKQPVCRLDYQSSESMATEHFVSQITAKSNKHTPTLTSCVHIRFEHMYKPCYRMDNRICSVWLD